MNFRFPFASRDGGKTIEHSDADGAKHLPRAQGLANGLALVVQGGKWVASTLSGVSVASVFGRTGAVVAQDGDYTAAQVGALGATAQAADSAKLEGHPASYFQIAGSGLVLGETSSTAYRGDRGKTAYDHTLATANAHAIAAITGLDSALAGKLPFVDLTTSPSTLDFSATGVAGSYMAACDWSRSAALAHAPYGPGGYGTLVHVDKSTVISQIFFSAGDYSPSSIRQIYTRAFWGGTWGAWTRLWGEGNLIGTRNEHNHDSFITKSTAYNFTGITASLIKHTNGDVVATLSGGVPGRSYTLVSVAALLIEIPVGVTLYGSAGIWDHNTWFTLGGMRPITIQCMSSTEWLLPNYGE